MLNLRPTYLLVHLGLLPSLYPLSSTSYFFLPQSLVEGMKWNAFSWNYQIHTRVVYILIFYIKIQLLAYLFFSYWYNSFFFIIGKQSWNRSPQQKKNIFRGGLDQKQSRLLPLLTHLTIKNFKYHSLKTPIKLYISNDCHRWNQSHWMKWMKGYRKVIPFHTYVWVKCV